MNVTLVHRGPAARLLPHAVAALLLAGCASGPYTTKILMQGSEQLNPTFDGASSAVNVRLFPIVDAAGFENASDDDLLQDPPKLPASSWLEPHVETVVYVGQSQALEIEIKPTVRFIGVLGLFNEEQGDHRALLSVDDIDDSKLVFDGFRFTIEPRGEGDEANG